MTLGGNQIYIGICRNEEMSDDQFAQYSSQLPLDIRERCGAKVFQSDKQSILLGRLLLLEYANMFTSNFDWTVIKYNDYGRPYWVNSEFEFNISHSGDYVVCCVQMGGVLGVDVENIKEVDLNDFKNAFCQEELHHLNSSSNLNYDFYQLWTRKEAYTKALGVGLNYPIHELNTLEAQFDKAGETISIESFDIWPNYVLSYASSKKSPELIIQNYRF